MNDTEIEKNKIIERLKEMPEFLRDSLELLSGEEARLSSPDGGFAPVEHVWHLADLESEGFGLRIRRLLSETEPTLPDFDGGQIAEKRDYKSLSLKQGLEKFEKSRKANLEIFEQLKPEDWVRTGIQEGVGKVTLEDIPLLMLDHDKSHRSEIESWKTFRSK